MKIDPDTWYTPAALAPIRSESSQAKDRMSGAGWRYVKAGARVRIKGAWVLEWLAERERRHTADPGQVA